VDRIPCRPLLLQQAGERERENDGAASDRCHCFVARYRSLLSVHQSSIYLAICLSVGIGYLELDTSLTEPLDISYYHRYSSLIHWITRYQLLSPILELDTLTSLLHYIASHSMASANKREIKTLDDDDYDHHHSVLSLDDDDDDDSSHRTSSDAVFRNTRPSFVASSHTWEELGTTQLHELPHDHDDDQTYTLDVEDESLWSLYSRRLRQGRCVVTDWRLALACGLVLLGFALMILGGYILSRTIWPNGSY